MSFADDVRRNTVIKKPAVADPNHINVLAESVLRQAKNSLMQSAQTGNIKQGPINGGLFIKTYVETRFTIAEYLRDTCHPRGTMFQFRDDGDLIFSLFSNDSATTKRFVSIIKNLCQHEGISVEFKKSPWNELIFRIFVDRNRLFTGLW